MGWSKTTAKTADRLVISSRDGLVLGRLVADPTYTLQITIQDKVPT